MSTHPNAILMAIFTPDDLTRKTLKNIMSDSKTRDEYILIGEDEYKATIMEDDYDEDYQITAKEGDIVIHQYITYGYSEYITWDDLVKKVEILDQWANEKGNKFACSYEIRISANYW